MTCQLRRHTLVALLLLSCLLTGGRAAAQCSSFSTLGGGLDGGVPWALTASPSGDVVAGGGFMMAGGVAVNRIARWDGSTWWPLGSGMNATVFALTAMPDGDIIAGGAFTMAGGVPVSYVARWDGASWSALGSGVGSTVDCLAVASNGDLIAGGRWHHVAGVFAPHVARWDGTSWWPMGSGIGPDVTTVVPLSNGHVAAGSVDGVHLWDGAVWTKILSVGPTSSGASFVSGLQEMANGDILACGKFSEIYTPQTGWVLQDAVARWDGTAWHPVGSSFAPGDQVYAVSSLPNGDPAVIARQSGLTRVLRWDGTDWTSLSDQTMNNLVYAMTSLPNGDLVAGGPFTAVGSLAAQHIVRFQPCRASHASYGSGCYTPALALSASPPPVSTPTSGTLVTYTIDDIPDLTGSSGTHVGATIISFGGDIPGTDLGFLGAAGCNLHVASLDVVTAFVDSTGSTSNATTLAIPPGVPRETALYAQAVALTLGGLHNAAGITTSNGTVSVIESY